MDALRNQIIKGRQERRPGGEPQAPALMRATVEFVEQGKIWVKVPALTGDQLHGPVPQCACGDMVVGDRVVIGAVAGSWADLVVLGRL